MMSTRLIDEPIVAGTALHARSSFARIQTQLSRWRQLREAKVFSALSFSLHFEPTSANVVIDGKDRYRVSAGLSMAPPRGAGHTVYGKPVSQSGVAPTSKPRKKTSDRDIPSLSNHRIVPPRRLSKRQLKKKEALSLPQPLQGPPLPNHPIQPAPGRPLKSQRELLKPNIGRQRTRLPTEWNRRALRPRTLPRNPRRTSGSTRFAGWFRMSARRSRPPQRLWATIWPRRSPIFVSPLTLRKQSPRRTSSAS